jgi:putative tricarboxylic transport membrane protein
MKKFSLVIILLLLLVTVLSLPVVEAKNVFPDKPIRIINYVAPGGLMDITTRKFVNIAAKYTKAVLVVENKPGAGGLVGI